MDTIQKAILFGGKAIVSVVNAKDLAQKAIDLQKTNDVASEVLVRVLSIGAFLSSGIKGADIKLSVTVDGNGKCGKIIVAGETGGIVRGYVQNANPVVSKDQNGKYNISEAFGTKGYLTVVKDFGMKNPYVGRTEIVNGSIDSDFAYYFTVSEGLPSAVATGSIIKDGKVESCGAIIVQPMPNCEEEYIVMLQDIVRNFADFGKTLQEKTVEQIIEENFGHFECKLLPAILPEFRCKCSDERMKGIIRSIDKNELENILKTQGQVEIHCDFCNKYYRYDKNAVEEILRGD